MSLLNIRKPENLSSYIAAFEKFLKNYYFNLSICIQTFQNYSCELKPIDLNIFFSYLIKNQINDNDFIEYFLSSPDKYKALDAFFMAGHDLLVGPGTLTILCRLVKGRYLFNDLLNDEKVGKEFEAHVAQEIEEKGFSIQHPQDPSIRLTNLKDNPDRPSLEIDIIAYSKNSIYVIDCKHILISTEFLSNNREKQLRKKLKEEVAKQTKRINYVRENIERFGFNTQQEIFNIIITYNKEPLQHLEGINIISVREIEKLKSLSSDLAIKI